MRKFFLDGATVAELATPRRGPEFTVREQREEDGSRPDAILHGQWLETDGVTPAGPAFRIGPAEPVPIEAFRSDGTIDATFVYPGIVIAVDPPRRSALLSVSRGSDEVMRIMRAGVVRAASPMPQVAPVVFGSTTATFRFPVFAERFTDRQRFLDHVDSLAQFIRTIPPFDRQDVREKMALLAYYWRSPSRDRGFFDTIDIDYDCVRDANTTAIFMGNRDRARDRLGALMFKGKYGLVLIDSTVRGGAGGQADYRYPAWSSITSCAHEDWRAVALHEIGHALDLADEYLLPALADQPMRDEPNVTDNADPDQAPWPVNRPGQMGRPTATLQQQQEMANGLRPIDREAIGTFQGARYRTDLFRPSYACLMRHTTTLHFCAVCRDAIIDKLGESS